MAITKITEEKNFEHRHYSDVLRIQKICRENGYRADLLDCAGMWEEESASFCAGWLNLPSDDCELWAILRYYIHKYQF